MTDKELIRALRCCGKLNKACGACPADNLCQFDGGQTAHEEAADRLESLIAEIERLKAQNWEEYCHDLHEYHCSSVPQWVSVKEGVLEPGVRVLATDGRFVGEFYINKQGRWKRYNANHYEFSTTLDIRWWMPFPAPPSTEGVE